MILHSIPGVAAIVFLMLMILYVKKDVSSSHMVEFLNKDFVIVIYISISNL